jgi:hypothetical protein
MEIRGNAILSTIFIKSADPGATVEVKYFQTTSGTIDVNERLDVTSHPVKDAANTLESSQIIVTRIHNKPVIEYIVTGGNVEFGVYVTVTDELASDIDSALHLDDSDVDVLAHKGIPLVCYDEAAGKWRLLRCVDGSLQIGVEEPGDLLFRQGSTATNFAGNPNSLDSFSVPVDKKYRFKRLSISCFADGIFTLTAGGVIIAKGRTGPSVLNPHFKFDPYREIAAGAAVSLTYSLLGTSPSDCTVDWFMQIREVDT